MITVVAAVIERADRRILICQRHRDDTSALKWEFPGGKVNPGETLEQALGRELLEELQVTMTKCAEIGSVRHRYSQTLDELAIHFFAAEFSEADVKPTVFENTAWALPKELGGYDFLAANRQLIAQLATGRIKPAELLANI